jgi:hypothetical protein
MRHYWFLLLILIMGLSSCMDRPMTNPQDEHGQVAAPVITPPPGTYQSSLSITITCATPGASIRYTTDGSEPNEYSSLYSVPVYVGGSTVIKARAYKQGMDASPVAASQYTLELPTVATPGFSLPSGSYTGPQTVSLSCATAGAQIRYTTNGTEPNSGSMLYTAPVSLTGSTVLKARGFKEGYEPSNTATASYTIVAPPVEVVYPNGGETLYLGQTYTVTWDPGPNLTSVDVLVYKGSQMWFAIQNYAANDGSISWTVSWGLQTGNYYRIRIQNSDLIGHPNDYDYSDGYFSVQAP